MKKGYLYLVVSNLDQWGIATLHNFKIGSLVECLEDPNSIGLAMCTDGELPYNQWLKVMDVVEIGEI